MTDLDTFTENPAAPHQAVAANNLGNQASSAIPERGQQHPFDAVVTSCSENGKSRRRIVSECFTVYYITVILLLKVSCFFGRKARCTLWSIWRPTRFLERVWRYEKLVFQANSCSSPPPPSLFFCSRLNFRKGLLRRLKIIICRKFYKSNKLLLQETNREQFWC